MNISHWSYQEVGDCVVSCLCMLTLELKGQRYSKKSYILALSEKLNNRSPASIQFKYCNISAILLELGYSYIDEYKPRSNYQKLLFEVVEKILSPNVSLQQAAQFAVNRPAITNMAHDVYPIWVDAPMSIKKEIFKNKNT